MKLFDKLQILSDSAKYDVACTSSGSDRKGNDKGVGNAVSSGICHSFTYDGRCISLLKVLFSNSCVYNCEYCINRKDNDIKRATFTKKELSYLTMEFYKRNYIEGLFLSSGVLKSPDYTMEIMIETIKMLRYEFGFNGYIHLKAIPGADKKLIEKAGKLVDRMSVNIELPSNESLKLLAPEKNQQAVCEPMEYINERIKEYKKGYKREFVPAGQSTQMIIGATKDTDYKILNLSEKLYGDYNLKRVFYSAYIPTTKSTLLPAIKNPPLKREHRLYQADWLLRFYGFKADELLTSTNQNLRLEFDPKCDWALRHLDEFPVEVNRADYFTLLRVPGIGIKGAKKIIGARRTNILDFESLKKMRIVMKRAKYFITCSGKLFNNIPYDDVFISRNLLLEDNVKIESKKYEQISIFNDSISVLTGEV